MVEGVAEVFLPLGVALLPLGLLLCRLPLGVVLVVEEALWMVVTLAS